MQTVVSTAGCTSVYLSAERPLRLRHVHRHHPHAHLGTLAITHSRTHTALMPQGTLSLCPQCPLVASPGMAAGRQLVTLETWTLTGPPLPPLPVLPPPVPPQQPESLSKQGWPSPDPQQRASPRVSQAQPLPATALLPEPSFAKAVPSAGNALPCLFHLTHSYPSRPVLKQGGEALPGPPPEGPQLCQWLQPHLCLQQNRVSPRWGLSSFWLEVVL